MVISAKIFNLPKESKLNEIRMKISNYKYETIEEIDGKPFKLLTNIKDVRVVNEKEIEAVYQKDLIIFINQRGLKNPVIKTLETRISFLFNGKNYLIIFGKKNVCNMIANELSKLLFIKIGKITEVRIAPEILQKYHENNKESTKVLLFDNLDIPGVNKLSLYGEALADTQLYYEYLKHGKIWYIVFIPKIIQGTVGLTRNGIVVFFGKISLEEFKSFIVNELIKIIEGSF